MALKSLSIAEMVKHSSDLVREGSPERVALESMPETAALMAPIERAHAGLVAAQPPNDSEIAELTETLTELDAAHDRFARAIQFRLDGEIELASGADGDALARALTALLPDGLSLVQRSYTEQAGEAELRAARVDRDVLGVLKKLKVYGGGSLEDVYERLQSTAVEIGALVKSRAELSEEGKRVASAREARNQWIRTINTLSSVLEMVGVDEAGILGRIREAERAAERRRASGPTPIDGPVTDEPTPDEPVTDTPTPDEPVVDDPT